MVYDQHAAVCLRYATFCLWGDLKEKVYRMNPHTEEQLKENIQKEILEVPQIELLSLSSDFFKRYRECLHVHGQHFQHRI
jgi:hypothetical protein